MARPPSIYPLLFTDSLKVSGKDCGVYGIQNRANQKLYIGSSVNLNRRKERHKSMLRSKKHNGSDFCKEFWERPDDFEFVTIEEVSDRTHLREREQFWITFYRSYLPEFGYNRSPCSTSNAGLVWDDEYKRRMSIAQTGLKKKKHPPRTPEQIERWRAIGLANRSTNVHKMKPVIQLDLNGVEVGRFECVMDAARHLGRKSAPHVFSVLAGRRQTAYGYKWREA